MKLCPQINEDPSGCNCEAIARIAIDRLEADELYDYREFIARSPGRVMPSCVERMIADYLGGPDLNVKRSPQSA